MPRIDDIEYQQLGELIYALPSSHPAIEAYLRGHNAWSIARAVNDDPRLFMKLQQIGIDAVWRTLKRSKEELRLGDGFLVDGLAMRLGLEE
jgi:hypothetical protein